MAGISKNYFYGNVEFIDLAKLRESAYVSARGDKQHEPVEAIIHFHRYEAKCGGVRHDVYSTDEVQEAEGKGEATAFNSYRIVVPEESVEEIGVS